MLPFQRISAVGRIYKDLDKELDILGALRRPYRRRKVSLLERLEAIVTLRHDLIHRMQMDINLDRKKLEGRIGYDCGHVPGL